MKVCILQDQLQGMVHSTGFSTGRTGTSVLSRVKSTIRVCHGSDGLSFQLLRTSLPWKWNGSKYIPFPVHILSLDCHSSSAAQICVCCVQQEIPTPDSSFANRSQADGTWITHKSAYSNSFASNINYLSTLTLLSSPVLAQLLPSAPPGSSAVYLELTLWPLISSIAALC